MKVYEPHETEAVIQDLYISTHLRIAMAIEELKTSISGGQQDMEKAYDGLPYIGDGQLLHACNCRGN